MRNALLMLSFLLLVGCGDKGNESAFGIIWGEEVSNISFIDKDKCESKDEVTTCEIGSVLPFNKWSRGNELIFLNDRLESIKVTITAGSDNPSDMDEFKNNLLSELDFISKSGADIEKIDEIKSQCIDGNCTEYSELIKTKNGDVKIWITSPPTTIYPVAVITYLK